MDMSQHPVRQITGLNDEDIALRLEVYGENGAFAADLKTLWQRAGDIMTAAMLAEAQRISATRVGRAADQVEQALAPFGLRNDVERFVRSSVIWLFTTPFDKRWYEGLRDAADTQVEINICSAIISETLCAVFNAAMDAIQEKFHEDAAFVRMARMRLMKLLGMKLELLADQASHHAHFEQSKLRLAQAETFRASVGTLLSQAIDGSKDLRSRTAAASGSARGMLGKTSEVAAAAEQSAIAMREAAQTAAGLIRAIEDARNEVEVAAGVATRAGNEAHRAVEVSKALSEHAQAIESILSLIRDIAGQTNLLALNATIEAARAGDAGRGFAVVAQEVKSLANQTARATDDIAAKIGAIQIATRETVDANGSIRATIRDVQTSAERIRTAMETQAQTVTMITAAVDETALAADAMSGTVAAIRSGTENLAGNIDKLDAGFRDVDKKLTTLETSAVDFTVSVS